MEELCIRKTLNGFIIMISEMNKPSSIQEYVANNKHSAIKIIKNFLDNKKQNVVTENNTVKVETEKTQEEQ